MTWSSSNSAAFDFQTNGSALPLYALFAVCLVVLVVGIVRYLRRLGPRGERNAVAGGGGRLVRLGLLQRRILRGADSGWLHLPIFWGFVVLALGSLTIMVDSYLLRPLGLGPPRGAAYRIFQASLDLFGVAFVLGIGLAIHRRLWTRPARKPVDGRMLAILFVLLSVGVSGFVLEGLRIRLEGVSEPWALGGSAVAAVLPSLLSADGSGMAVYRILWWGHVVLAFGLIAAVPFTALRHVFTAPLHIHAASERPSGALSTPFRLQEVIQSGSFDVKVGVSTVEEFSRQARLGFAACADAGHCQQACPAHAAGTALSPLRVLGALRSAPAQRPLGDVVSEEAIWACTMCGACAEACPVLVDPMGAIAELRRGLVAGNRPGSERTTVLDNLFRARNPYGANGAERQGLSTALGVPGADEHGPGDTLYWIGCAATFDPRVRRVAEATVRILERAGIRCTVLGPEETCCGDPARRIGEEGLFQTLALENIATLERRGVKRVLTHCAHCFNTLRNEYGALGARFEVVHHATLIDELIRSGSIVPVRGELGSVTLHDACYVGRFNGGFEPPRSALRSLPGARLTEMDGCRAQARCCGGGGGNYWYEVPRREKISAMRMRDVEATGASLLVTECPFCLKMLDDACPAGAPDVPRVRDIAEVVADSLPEAAAP